MGLAKRIAEALAKLDPDLADKKADQADADRDVTFWSDPIDGKSGVAATGPIDKVAQIKAAIDSLARHRDPTTRGCSAPAGSTSSTDGPARSSACRSMTRTRVVRPAPAPGSCDACGRSGPSTIPINVTISLEALLRLSETPGALDGVPIPASVARQLAADGRWRRFVTEPSTGRLLDVGANTYRPTDALLRFVRARNPTCIFPNCTRRAHQCDCDHTRPFHTAGGRTTSANLAPVCRTHHRCKHELGWNYRRKPTDEVTWKAPSGRTYTTEPDYYADDPQLTDYLTAQSRRRQTANAQNNHASAPTTSATRRSSQGSTPQAPDDDVHPRAPCDASGAPLVLNPWSR